MIILFNPNFHFTVYLLLQPLMAGRMNYWWVKIIVGNWITNRKLKSTSCSASGGVEPLLLELIHASFVMFASFSLWSTSRYSFFCSSVQKKTFRLSRVTWSRFLERDTVVGEKADISKTLQPAPKQSRCQNSTRGVRKNMYFWPFNWENYHGLTTKINLGAHELNSQVRSPVSKLL